jgi:hypothetical protein
VTIESYDAAKVREALLDALRAVSEGREGWLVSRKSLCDAFPKDLDYELERLGYEIRKIP